MIWQRPSSTARWSVDACWSSTARPTGPAICRRLTSPTQNQTMVALPNRTEFPEKTGQNFRNPHHVVAVAPLVIYGGIFHEASDQFPSVATEAKEIDMWSDWGLTGVDEFKKIKTACLVAQGTMRRFNLHVGQQIPLRGTVYPFHVT